MKQKQAAMLAVCAVLLFCVTAAGCTSSTSPSPNAAATANSSSHAATASATATATPTASATATPTPTVTPTGSPSGGTAGFTVLYIYEVGCPYCAAFENTSSYAQLQQTGLMQRVPSTDTSTLSQLPSKVTAYPTVVLLKNGSEVGSWVYPNIDTTAILAQINAG